MKKLTAFLLALCMVLSLAACGSSASTDPNAGVYEATTGDMLGMSVPITDFYDGGFTITLKDNGKCELDVDGSHANGKWTLDGTAFTVSGGGFDGSGTLENGVIYLENMLDSGLNMTFEKAE